MNNIEIRRPRIEDTDELHLFFSKVIRDTFYAEGLMELEDTIINEIECKKRYLRSDIETNGEVRFFLIAIDQTNNKIIGSIEYGAASELVINCTNGELEDYIEIGTIYVAPDYQRKGIGTLLLNVMLLTLQIKGFEEFCLDSGYKRAQKVWQKKFGEPDYLLRDYWGSGQHHMIWKRKTLQTPIRF